MQYAQDVHCVAGNGVRNDVRRMVDDKFTSPTHAADATAFGMANQLLYLQSDTVVDSFA